MQNLAELISAPLGQVAIWIEAGDGSRQKVKDVLDFPTARVMIEEHAALWKRGGPFRQIKRVDEVTYTLRIARLLPQPNLAEGNTKPKPTYETVGVLYIEPLPRRNTHKGDVRVDRALVPRRPIP